jgi:small subunit ribosomal protein S6
MTEETKPYQLTCLLSPVLEQSRIEEISQKIKKWINEKGGSLSERENHSIFKKNLAYSLKKYREAFYLNFSFLLAGQDINQLSQKLNLEKDVLRHFVTANPQPKTKAEEVMDQKIADKIEPLVAKEIPLASREGPKQANEKRAAPNQEKVKIEELDKKLDEILNQ